MVYGAIVYRLGHQVFILRSGVRLPVALPKFKHISLKVWVSDLANADIDRPVSIAFVFMDV